MKKLYIVISDFDEYDDNYKVNECVCSSYSLAENKKKELENNYKEETPFPFDWITNEEFLDVWYKMTDDDIDTYLKWENVEDRRKAFNYCFIQEIDYYDNTKL